MLNFLFPLFLIIGTPDNKYSQMDSRENDNLSKYSYFVFTIKDENNTEQGTGFFLKKDNRLFFVTTAHFIGSWDSKNNKPYAHIMDSFYLRLYKEGHVEPFFISIDVKEIRKEIKKGYAFEFPDLYIMEFNNSDNYQINYIEIEQNIYPVKPPITSLTIFGFPVIDSVNDINVYVRLPPSKSTGTITANYSKIVTWAEFNKSDYLNYQINIIEGVTKKGISGSPVFMKLPNIDKMVFGGMVILGDEISQLFFALRPEVIIDALNKK